MIKNWLNTRVEKWQSPTIAYTDPLTAGRHPFQVYLLSLALVSGIVQLIGSEPPSTLEDNLPETVVLIWSWMLVIGAFLGLSGSLWRKRSYATGLTVERIGLFATGVSAIIYGGFILTLGVPGIVAGAITAGFGWACLIRARHIGQIFKRALDPNPPDVDTKEGR